MHITAARYLALARNALDMDLAWLSEHTGPDQVLRVLHGESRAFGVAEGDALPWDGSFCIRVLDQRLPNVIPDARKNPVTAALPVTEQLGIGSYVGTPVRLPDGALYGMLCCVSRNSRTDFREDQLRLLEAIAASLAAELADDMARREQSDSVHHRIRRVIGGEGLRMVVQPIVDLATMRPVGVETLARFDRPPARPDAWFAEAAELGLGVLLEVAAVHSALGLLDDIPEHLYLSVNVSPATLTSDALLDAISGVNIARVVLELTEHSSVADYDELLSRLIPLRERGVRVAVDDAGAGYASFRHILALQPHIIKFDRHLVAGLNGDPARRALVGSLVSFAEQIGATLVAEGVETPGELDMLQRLGVSCAQGYHLGRPGPLPIPGIIARPSATRYVTRERSEPADRERSERVEEHVSAVLREVVARTGLEGSYFSLWNPERETLEHRIVYDPQNVGIRLGLRVPWKQTPCYQCYEAGILWTADIQAALPPASPMHGTPFRTFLSVQVRDASGRMLGTLCAVDREHRYLSDRAVEHVQRLSIDLAPLVSRLA